MGTRENRFQWQYLWDKVFTGKFTVNLGNAATGSGTFATTTVTVPGAALGDFVMVAPALDLTDGFVFGQVSAANTVDITVLNNTAGALDLASATYRVVVLRPSNDAFI